MKLHDKQAIILGLLVVIGVGAGFVWHLRAPVPQPQSAFQPAPGLPPGLPVTLAASASLTSSLVWLASDRGAFAEAGVDVTVKGFSYGKLATDAMVRGEADFCSTAEYVLAKMVPDHPNLRAVATVATSHDIRVVAAKDSGISSPADLAGKRIGLTLGSSTEFLVDRLLALHGVASATVERVDLAPPAMPEALNERKVDAVIVWQPHARAVLNRMGGTAVVFDGQPNQDYFAVLASRKEWLHEHRDAARRVLLALKRAEEWADRNPASFLAYLRTKGFLGDEGAQDDMAGHHFSVALPSSLIAALGEERRWLDGRSRGGVSAHDVLDLIDPAPLRDVAPRAVTVVH